MGCNKSQSIQDATRSGVNDLVGKFQYNFDLFAQGSTIASFLHILRAYKQTSIFQ